MKTTTTTTTQSLSAAEVGRTHRLANRRGALSSSRRRPITAHLVGPGRVATGLVFALFAAGCGHEREAKYTSVSKPPSVRLIHPQVRTIKRIVGQPSFVVSYERSSVYPKMTAYIERWIVDIGDKVKKDDVLATLFVPELVESYRTKQGIVKVDKEQIALAKTVVQVADADVKAAEADVVEAQAILVKFQAEVERWDVQVKRLTTEVQRSVISPQILLESQNQLKSNTAARDAAKATILKAQAHLLAKQAALAKANVDVAVAEADLGVAESEEARLKAWVGYLTLTAPFDGVIAARNANTFDFVLPSTGDPTAMKEAPDLSPSGTAAPIYVVDRTDIVRVFVDIPERDANYVHGSDLRLMGSVKDVKDLPQSGRELVVLARLKEGLHVRIFDAKGKRAVDAGENDLAQQSQKLGELKRQLENHWNEFRVSPLLKEEVLAALGSIVGADKVPVGTKGSVLIRAYRDDPIPGRVTRTSWALNMKSRTLRAEIDLPNAGTELLPGMYAYAKVMIERSDVRALPSEALTYSGDRTYCWIFQGGKAVRNEIRTGISDGEWIEVTNLMRPADSNSEEAWAPISGKEEVILGDLSILADGADVEVARESADRTGAHRVVDRRPLHASP